MEREEKQSGLLRRLAEAGPVRVVGLCAVAAAALTLLLYVLDRAAKHDLSPAGLFASAATLLAFTAVFLTALPALVSTLRGEGEAAAPLPAAPEGAARRFVLICAAALALHAAAGLLGAWVYLRVEPNAPRDGFLALWREAWMKGNTDAGHYLNLAENGYVSEGHDQLLLVFFPMFPALVARLEMLVHDFFLAAQLLNAAAVSLCAGMTDLTLRPILGARRSAAAAFILLLLPGMIFLNSPMSEPLFLLFAVCAFFFIGKRRFLAAGLFTALAGYTRSLGVLTALPLAVVGVGQVVRTARDGGPWRRELLRLLAALLLSCAGTLEYLYLNYSLHGDCLQFLDYQWSNWYQKAAPFFDTPRYMLASLMGSLRDNPHSARALWAPGLLAIAASLLLMLAGARRLPASHSVYFLAYFAVSIGCTWLLSAVRYLSAALPVAASLALFCDRRRKTVLLFALLLALYFAYLLMYMRRWDVY